MTRRLLLMACIGAAGCGLIGPDDVVEREFEVAAYLAGCTGVGDGYCLLVRSPGAAEFGYLYDTPAGFDFEWGRQYRIVVEEREDPSPPADGSSIVRRLDRVVSSAPVPPGTTFGLNVPSGFVQPSGGTAVELAYQPVVVDCGDDCAALAAATSSTPRVLLELRFGENPGGALELVGWEPCDNLSRSPGECRD